MRRYLLRGLIIWLFVSFFLATRGYSAPLVNILAEDNFIADSTQEDIHLQFPIPQISEDGAAAEEKSLYLKTGAKEIITYNAATHEYTVSQMMGDYEVSRKTMSFEEYLEYDMQKSLQKYWKDKNSTYTPSNTNSLKNLIPGLDLNVDLFNEMSLKDLVDIKFQGSFQLIFGFIANRRDDPAMDVQHRRVTSFNFEQKIEINLNAKIANRFDFNITHNTDALMPNIDNKLKLRYEGKEDEIVKSLELGNISFPLNNSLIQGAQNLFGVKAQLQFGRTFVTGVFSEQRSESKNVTVEGGAETSKIKFRADDYEENRHYFVAQYFYDNYHEALKDLPVLNSSISIGKIEVWVTNIGSPVENNRNIVAFTDLGEKNPMAQNLGSNPAAFYPSNSSNNLLNIVNPQRIRKLGDVNAYLGSIGYSNGREYEKVESARRLNENEYSFNAALGFISLNTPLNSDQVLAVSFQYQVIGDPTVYQVGELSDEGITDPDVLIVKLLKSTTLDTKSPLWRLMMKNVYSLRSYQVSSEDFRLNILYSGDQQGIPTGYFTDGPLKGVPLVRLFGMDNLDFQQNKLPDGVFDFLDGATTGAGYIESGKGIIFLPYTEPFGKDIYQIFGSDSAAAKKYAFEELYSKTKVEAQQYPSKNKFYFEGSFKSSLGSEISLGAFNIPKGSVRVMAGSNALSEDIDYTVDYQMGIVRIINQGVLNSGVPINISTESTGMSLITKRMMGLRVEHVFSKHFQVGATILNLHQSPLTQKVNFGEEPVSNTIYGFDIAYEKESRFLTQAVDAILPFASSKVPSRLNLYGEFAHFIPGQAKTTGKPRATYIDDFEGSKTTINLKEPYAWYLASTPQFQPDMFLEASPTFASSVFSGMNRARLSWYIIDPIFYENQRPSNIKMADLLLPYVRRVSNAEVFPNKQLGTGQVDILSVLNLAYYPAERGPYNYDGKGVAGISAGLMPDGSLKNPDTRWAGIMRKIDNTDFEATNVEYIEFWVMDPFIGRDGNDSSTTKHSGGKLYFNLGDISEDILRDGKKSFENGMPITPEIVDVEETQWGRVPTVQSIVRTFDNDPNTRQYQDIGLDGLNDEDERIFFSSYLEELAGVLSPDALAKISDDPSADNYMYFRGKLQDTWTDDHKIQNRYKYFTNPQGNSPSSSQYTESYSTAQTNYPNNEDISGDNTLSEAENYYQYEVDLHPDRMNVGDGYLSDIQFSRNVLLQDGKTRTDVKWYQFKIPIKNPDRVVGQMQNFQSIRFIRMFLKDFKEEVVLRFASLDLVKSDWRKHIGSLVEDNIHIPSSSEGKTEFSVSVVNIEENGRKSPIPYVIPPDVYREQDFSTQNLRRLNEQSVSLKVTDLADGDARGIYKTTDFDFRQFKRIEMYTHMERVYEYDRSETGDIHLFIRLGADFEDNYYEYSIPLEYTQWGETSPEGIWPAANMVELILEDLVAVKERRNEAMREGDVQVNYQTPYVEKDGKITYTVKGTPSISDIKSLLIGLRNPQKGRINDMDDGLPKSVEVWINELTLNDFSRKGGVAATGRMQATLGDLGNVNLAGAFTSANFGTIEQKVNELPQDNVVSVDFSTNLEIGKFLPEKTGLKLPFHYDVSATIANPAYNPLDPDIKTDADLASYSPSERAEMKKQIQDYTIRQNVNLMNVRKERTNTDKEARFYNIENFSVSYAYSETKRRNIDIEYDNKITHKGGISYNFATKPKYFEPFASTKMADKKIFDIISSFNVNYVPNEFSFSTEIQREMNENKLRNKSFGDIIIEPTYYKRFDWTRNYTFKYDITKSIRFSYAANANSFLKEPPGKINSTEKKEEVWNSFFKGGSMKHFDQNMNLVWQLPINKIPFLSWVSTDATYGAMYRWDAGALSLQERLGNVIANNRNIGANARLNFVELYNKSSFLRKINNPSRRRRTRISNETIAVKKEDNKEDDAWKTLYKGSIRFLMMLRDVSANWSRNDGTSLPGFMPEPTLFGIDFASGAPSFPFVFGSQQDIREKAAMNGWISRDSLMNTAYARQSNETYTFKAVVEPFYDFKIEINMGLSRSNTNSSYFKYDMISERYVELNPMSGGSYNVSNVMVATLFKRTDKNYENEAFKTFLENRLIIAQRLGQTNPNSYNRGDVYDTTTGKYYPFGYTSRSQEVMIPAFIAAYTGQDPNKVRLGGTEKFPLPNWTVSYSGLTKIQGLNKVFKNLILQHAYKSSYSVGGYKNNINFAADEYGNAIGLDMNQNFIGADLYDGVSMSEQFSPLIKVSMTFVNDLSLNFEMRKSRTLNLSFVNNQLTEISSDEYVVGAGYRIKDVAFKINQRGGGKRTLKNDIILKADFSIKDNRQLLRKIDQSIFTPSSGAIITSINVYAEYEVTERLTTRIFYDLILNSPHVSNLFYTSTGKGGVSITYRIN